MTNLRTIVKKWKQGAFAFSDIDYYFGDSLTFFTQVMKELEQAYLSDKSNISYDDGYDDGYDAGYEDGYTAAVISMRNFLEGNPEEQV